MIKVEQTGTGKYIITSKCDIDWTDVYCPNPVTCARYHFGQFGHKILFLFCDECWAKPDPIPSLRNLDWLVKVIGQDEPAEPPKREDSFSEDEYFERYSPEEAERLHHEWNNLIRSDDGTLPRGAGIDRGRD